MHSTGTVNISGADLGKLAGKHCLLVEDIIDTGERGGWARGQVDGGHRGPLALGLSCHVNYHNQNNTRKYSRLSVYLSVFEPT